MDYNLIRLEMLQSSASNNLDPRRLSFTTTLQMLANSWLLCAGTGVTEALCTLGQAAWRSERVGHRTGRVEPR